MWGREGRLPSWNLTLQISPSSFQSTPSASIQLGFWGRTTACKEARSLIRPTLVANPLLKAKRPARAAREHGKMRESDYPSEITGYPPPSLRTQQLAREHRRKGSEKEKLTAKGRKSAGKGLKLKLRRSKFEGNSVGKWTTTAIEYGRVSAVHSLQQNLSSASMHTLLDRMISSFREYQIDEGRSQFHKSNKMRWIEHQPISPSSFLITKKNPSELYIGYR